MTQRPQRYGTGPGSGRRLCALAALAAICVVAAGCQSTDDVPTLEQELARALPEGAPIDGARVWTGYARNPSSLERDGIFRIETRDALRRLWEAQCPGPVPDIDFSRNTVIGAFFTRAEATRLDLVGFRRAPDGSQELWLVGDTAPLKSVRYNFPWCIVALPTRGGRVHVNLLYAYQQATGEWRIRNRGTRLIIQQ